MHSGISPDAIATYTREGGDLVIGMTDGETLRIASFYAEGQPPSQLYLLGAEDELVLVELAPVTAEGVIAASYVPQEIAAGFESLTGAGALAAGGVGTAGMIAGGVVVAGGVAAASNSGGGSSDEPPSPPEQVAPPTDLSLSADGLTITGSAAPGSTVELDLDGDGVADFSASVGADGRFTLTVQQPLNNGELVELRTRLPSGLLSDPATLQAPDSTAPLPPTDLAISPDGALLTGKAEPGSTVSIVGRPGVTAIAEPDGSFEIPLVPPLTNGEVVEVIATDEAGNEGSSASVEAPDSTAPLPPTDLAISPDGTLLTGKAEPGSTVSIVGRPGVTAIAEPDGSFEIPLAPPLTNGEVVEVIATDEAGNEGSSASVEAPDSTAPLPPTDLAISPDGALLTGKAEPGSTVSIVGRPGVTAIAEQDGSFEIPLAPPLTNGETVAVTATDEAGNQGSSASVNAPDSTAPLPPTDLAISPDGTLLTGKAEPGSTVSIVGRPGVTAIAEQDGSFEIPLAPPLTNGESVAVTATDEAGNEGSSASVNAPDSTAPLPPTDLAISPDGTLLTGKAEPGSTVSIVGRPGVTAIAEPDGSFEIPLVPPLTNGETVAVTATDEAGNEGSSASVNAPDSTAPLPPTDLAISPDGALLTGKAEPGSTVSIVGRPGVTAIAEVDGSFEIPLAPPLTNGETVAVTARDEAGNEGSSASVNAPDTTAPLPPTDLAISPDGALLTGKAEPGSTVSIVGRPGVTAVAEVDGSFEIPLAPPLTNGETVAVTARDEAGNEGSSTSVNAPDTTAPLAPTDLAISSDGTLLTGKAEPGSTVVISGPGGLSEQAVADENGDWEIVLTQPLADGAQISVTAKDDAGNVSDPASLTIEFAPSDLRLSSDGRTLTGQSAPGRTLDVDVNGDGVADYTVMADSNGFFTLNFLASMNNGELITVRNSTVSSPPKQALLQAPDDLAPALASHLQMAPDGSKLTGQAEPGSTVKIDTNGDGIADLSAPVGADGQFVIVFNPPLVNGEKLTVVVTDAAGNSNAGRTVIAPDTTPPDAPDLTVTNGRVVTGTAEAGASVVIVVIGSSTVSVPVDANGNWTYTPIAPIPDGTTITATARDAAGNVSPPASVTVTASLPNPPVINQANGNVISGTGVPNSTVVLQDGNGGPIAQAAVDAFGNWSVPLNVSYPPGTTLVAFTQTAQGQSASISVPLDTQPPAITVTEYTGTQLSGTSEAGSTITLSDSNGVLGQVTTDGAGNWTFRPTTPLPDGETVTVTSRDSAGNASAPSNVVVDAVPPTAPTIQPTTGTALNGTAEPGSRVVITDDNGRVLAELIAAPLSGAWSFTPSSAIADGTQVTVVAQDAAGNKSPSTTITVDNTAPPAPVVNPSNGTTFTGTAEPGATVTLRDANGTPIGDTTADPVTGTWTINPTTTVAGGITVTVVASDATGNTSQPTPATADTTPPPPPVVAPTNGSEISGTAEPGSFLVITAGNVTIGPLTVSSTGHWSVVVSPAIGDGTPITATATDAVGNTSTPSAPTNVIGTLPDRPTLDPSNGTTISGTAPTNATVVLTDGAGNPIATVTADAVTGQWTYTASPPLANNTEVNAAVRDGLGNLSAPATTVVDSVPPPVPSVAPSNGTVLSGTAEAGSTILLTGPGLNAQVAVDGNGNWTYNVPGAPLADLTQVTVIARDAVGNDSPSATLVIDRMPPANPSIALSNGSVLTGTAEPGSVITLTTGAGGLPLGTTTTDVNGNWSFTPVSPLPHGIQVNVQARDALGNPSGVTITNVDALPPAAPTVSPSKGDVISGTAEANAQITLTDASGNVIGQTTAVGGVWSFTPTTALPDGTLVKVTATDAAGNLGAATTITIDTVPPLAPTIAPTQGDTLTGTAEAGTTVRLTDGNGGLIGNALTDAFGNWTFPVSPALPNGTTVNAVAVDPAGNVSPPVSTVTDDVPPAIPSIEPSNGKLISGTADIGSTVLLTLPDGTMVEVPVDNAGNWSYTPNPALLDGDPIRAAARDVAGNESLLSPVTVIDTVPPATPTIDPSQGSTLTGTAEPNTDVVITIGSGTPITVTSNGSGDWTYTPTPAVPDGTTVTVVARDPAGNDSPPASTVIDSVVPTVTLEASNGNLLTGMTEAGATVTISGLSNSPVSVIAGPDGRWEYTPIAPPAHNAAISVVAEDAAGNASGPADIVIDRLAPAVSLQPSDGTLLRGLTEGGATVVISTGSGTVLATVTADPGGNWTYTPTPPLLHNTAISVTASDALGNTSAPAIGTVDSVAPDAPTIDPSQGVLLEGIAEPGSRVTLSFSSGGSPVTVDANPITGAWSYSPQPALPNGTTVTIEASDASGNTSPTASIVTDNQPPAPPVIAPSNGQSISGTAEAGSRITISAGGQSFVAVADANGYWSVSTAGAGLADGAPITAIATDASGNPSLAGNGVVDTQLPDAPTIDASNGTAITGRAGASETVVLTDGVGNPIATVTADPAGNWQYTPSPPLANGIEINAQVRDGANNLSAPATTVVDTVPPATPTVEPSNGQVLVGTGEPGSSIILNGGGLSNVEVTVDANGNWTYDPSPDLANNAQVTIISRDAAGNPSGSVSVTIDAAAPATPTINASNGITITGSGEIGSIVVLSVGGTSIGTTTVGVGGTWTFTANPPIGDGLTIQAAARDAVGNTSGNVSTVVDATPPPVPTVNPSNGTVLSGTAETGATVVILINGVEVGSTTAVGGSWNIGSLSLPNNTVVSVVTRDALGNTSAPTTVTVDASPPAVPTVNAGNGSLLSGTAEAGAFVVLVQGNGTPITTLQADPSGNWSYNVNPALPHNTVVRAVVVDAAGNQSNPGTATVDSQAPTAPTGQVNADGTLLTGTAEAGSTVRIILPGNSTPILVTATNGTYSVVLAPALIAGQIVSVTATDAAGNTSNPATVFAPNLAPPVVGVAEAADNWINAAELSNGIQVQIGLQSGVRVGDSVTLSYRGANGFLFTNVHTVTAAEVLAGAFSTTLVPPGGNGSYPQGAGSVTAHVNSGVDAAPVNFVVDTIAPSTPVLSLAGSLLTISGDPGVALTVTVNIGGVIATTTVTANNAGIASLNLLTALSIGLTWDQLLSAQIGVTARDPAGNPSTLASVGLGVGTNLSPITLSNLAVDANLSLGGAKLGITGTTNANASLSIEVISPLINVTLSPILANASGQFSLNLLSPSVLSQLGLTIGGLLNLGPDLQLRITTTSGGKQSAAYTIDLDPLGLLGLTIGAITITGTVADDIVSGTATAAERIVTGGGNDLILNVGSGDRVEAGAGHDTIQIKASNFVSIDGGSGFDTLLLDGGIDINFSTPGVGSVTNIERLDLGTGDSGSLVVLTSAQVDAMTDANNVLQITGDSNDVLRVIGAVNTNITQTLDGIRYNVFTFSNTLLYVEENTVQVIV